MTTPRSDEFFDPEPDGYEWGVEYTGEIDMMTMEVKPPFVESSTVGVGRFGSDEAYLQMLERARERDSRDKARNGRNGRVVRRPIWRGEWEEPVE